MHVAEARQKQIAEQALCAEKNMKENQAQHQAQIKELEGKINKLQTEGMNSVMRDAYDEMELRLKHAIKAYQDLEEKYQQKQ